MTTHEAATRDVLLALADALAAGNCGFAMVSRGVVEPGGYCVRRDVFYVTGMPRAELFREADELCAFVRREAADA